MEKLISKNVNKSLTSALSGESFCVEKASRRRLRKTEGLSSRPIRTTRVSHDKSVTRSRTHGFTHICYTRYLLFSSLPKRTVEPPNHRVETDGSLCGIKMAAVLQLLTASPRVIQKGYSHGSINARRKMAFVSSRFKTFIIVLGISVTAKIFLEYHDRFPINSFRAQVLCTLDNISLVRHPQL